MWAMRRPSNAALRPHQAAANDPQHKVFLGAWAVELRVAGAAALAIRWAESSAK